MRQTEEPNYSRIQMCRSADVLLYHNSRQELSSGLMARDNDAVGSALFRANPVIGNCYSIGEWSFERPVFGSDVVQYTGCPEVSWPGPFAKTATEGNLRLALWHLSYKQMLSVTKRLLISQVLSRLPQVSASQPLCETLYSTYLGTHCTACPA